MPPPQPNLFQNNHQNILIAPPTQPTSPTTRLLLFDEKWKVNLVKTQEYQDWQIMSKYDMIKKTFYLFTLI